MTAQFGLRSAPLAIVAWIATSALAAPDGGIPPPGQLSGQRPVQLPVQVPVRASLFLGEPDEHYLQVICEQPITRLVWNKVGTTIKYRVTLADGTRAQLRPEQINEAGYFRADVASYRLSQRMALGTVPPACLRTIPQADLVAATPEGELRKRLEKEVKVGPDGMVQASLVLWVSNVSATHLDQRVAEWRPLLVQSESLLGISEEGLAMAREASRLIAWDVLIANWDRWSGGNTFRVGQREVWLDNAAGFGRYTKEMQRKNEKPLVGVERFSRSLIGALSGVSEEQLRLALAPARLSRVQEQELMARRRDLLRYVDELVAKYGIAEVLCFD